MICAMTENPAPRLEWTAPVRWALGAGVVALGLLLWWGAEWRGGLGRWMQGDKVKLEALVRSCWWWAGLGVGGASVVLWGTSGWWARRWSAVWPKAAERAPRWWLGAVLGLMVLGAAVRVPRLGLSLYNDEAHAFRAHLAGEVPRAHLGNPAQFRALSWWSTLFENRVGNNSLPFSLVARASYGVWRGVAGAPVGRVNEVALRLPVLVAGVLSIGVLAWLGRRLGGPGAGLAVAMLGAFHPWHVRYSVEARSYGLLLLMVPLLYVALEAALRTGRWRAWLGLGLAMGMGMAVWVGTAHLLLALYVTLGVLAASPARRGRRADLLVPLGVAGVVAVGCYAAINLPLHLQLAKILRDPLFFKSGNPFPLPWFQDVAGYMGFGIPGLPVAEASQQPSVMSLWAGPWGGAVGAVAGLWVAGLIDGAGRLRGGAGLGVVGSLVGGALFTWGYCTMQGTLFLKWYAIFLLPGLLVVLGVGLGGLLRGRSRWLGAAVALAFVAAWVPGLACYGRQGRENLRGAVELARGVPYPESLGNPQGSLYAVTWSESPVYDPAAVALKRAAQLRDLMRQAREEGRPLYVALGHQSQARQEAGEVLGLLEDAGQFRVAAVLPGLDEASFTHYLYQLLPPGPPGLVGGDADP